MSSEPPGDRPGEVVPRRLERPPSERYRSAAEPGDASDPRGTSRPGPDSRGVPRALAVAGLAVVAVVLVYGVLATTTGLIVVAGASGFLVGIQLRARPSSTTTAVLLAVGAMVLAIFGGWLVSLTQGGVAGPLEYVLQTLGLLAIVVPLVAGASAALATRE